jgi:hypothetical protein
MTLAISRQGRLYCKAEASYGPADTTFAATDAVQHREFKPTYDPFARVTLMDKKTTPGAVRRADRRVECAWSLEAYVRPSGTLNTIPEADDVFKAAFGSIRNVTLSTTVSAGTGAVGGATLASATGLAIGDALSIVVSGLKYARVITAVNTGTGVTTWSPNLPGIPTDGAVVKAGIAYKLTTDLAISLAFVHYLTGYGRMLVGAGVDQFGIAMNANEEPVFTASGPAKRLYSPSGVYADPATFTTAGGLPPTCIVGDLWIGNTVYKHKDAQLSFTNGIKARNVEAGNDGYASEIYRAGRRTVELSLASFAETQATLHDLAFAGTECTVLKQIGRTEGNIIALYMPRWEPKIPDTTDGDEEADWGFKGACLETADGQNNEVSLLLL